MLTNLSPAWGTPRVLTLYHNQYYCLLGAVVSRQEAPSGKDVPCIVPSNCLYRHVTKLDLGDDGKKIPHTKLSQIVETVNISNSSSGQNKQNFRNVLINLKKIEWFLFPPPESAKACYKYWSILFRLWLMCHKVLCGGEGRHQPDNTLHYYLKSFLKALFFFMVIFNI